MLAESSQVKFSEGICRESYQKIRQDHFQSSRKHNRIEIGISILGFEKRCKQQVAEQKNLKDGELLSLMHARQCMTRKQPLGIFCMRIVSHFHLSSRAELDLVAKHPWINFVLWYRGNINSIFQQDKDSMATVFSEDKAIHTLNFKVQFVRERSKLYMHVFHFTGPWICPCKRGGAIWRCVLCGDRRQAPDRRARVRACARVCVCACVLEWHCRAGRFRPRLPHRYALGICDAPVDRSRYLAWSAIRCR